jgi:hypothetical protein
MRVAGRKASGHCCHLGPLVEREGGLLRVSRKDPPGAGRTVVGPCRPPMSVLRCRRPLARGCSKVRRAERVSRLERGRASTPPSRRTGKLSASGGAQRCAVAGFMLGTRGPKTCRCEAAGASFGGQCLCGARPPTAALQISDRWRNDGPLNVRPHATHLALLITPIINTLGFRGQIGWDFR